MIIKIKFPKECISCGMGVNEAYYNAQYDHDSGDLSPRAMVVVYFCGSTFESQGWKRPCPAAWETLIKDES